MSHVPGRACPLLPARRSGVSSATSSLSQQPSAAWWVLLCPSPCAPGPAGTPSAAVPGRLPPHAGRPALQLLPGFPPRAAGRWVPGLPALPGEAGAGRGAEMAGGGQRAAGRGKAERADCKARAASGTLFLAARSPGVLSFTHLFTPGRRGLRGAALPRGAERRGGGSQPDLPPLGAKGGR